MRLSRLLPFLLLALPCWGQTVTATTCNQVDVAAAAQTILNNISTGYKVLQIPAGNCTWTSQVIIYANAASPTSFSILGAGNITSSIQGAGGGDVTVITDNDTTDSSSLIIVYNTVLGQNFRMAGFTVTPGTGIYKQNGEIAINGYSQTMRVDHIHLHGTTSATVVDYILRINNWQYGVVDHSLFDGAAAVVIGMDSYGNPTGGGSGPFYGDGSWTDSTRFGSANAIYMEYDIFDYTNSQITAGGSAEDCALGGRFVVRHNTIVYGSTQTHPTGGNGRGRGCRTQEVYLNNFNTGVGTGASYNVWFDSSGPSMIWGNTAQAGGFNNFITYHNELQGPSTYTQTATPNGWGYCGTSSGLPGDGSGWGFSPTGSGNPCLDMPGRGQSDTLIGNFPTVCDQTAGCTTYNGTWPNQLREPIYEWMDAWTPIPGQSQTIFTSGGGTLTENADFYGQCGALSATCSGSFTGALGTGYGLLSARPSSCTAGPSGSQNLGPGGISPGVGYWATDMNTFYVCSVTGSPGTWAPYYTPYVDPHPLDTSATQTNPPAISPSSGTYVSPQTVTMTCSNAGCVICYTVDGSIPTANGGGSCTHGTTYSGSFSQTISGSGTNVQAIATTSGLTDSSVTSVNYSLPPTSNPSAPVPVQMVKALVTGLYASAP